MILVALDVGTQTIGVATGRADVALCTPQFTLSRQGVRKDVAALQARIITPDVSAIVVGLAIKDDGTEGRSAKLARQVGEALREATGLPVHYQDESYSSVEAETRLRAAGQARRLKELIDQVAAVVILEDWLAENPQTEAPR